MEKKSKGILILAFGDRGYHYAAFNLCLSIKHYNPSVKVAIYHSSQDHVDYKLCGADVLKEFTPDSEPGYNKIHSLGSLPFDNTLYVDADSVCMKDVSTLLDQLSSQDRYFLCEVIDRGKYGTEIQYDLWAHHEDSFPFFGIDKDTMWYSTQTSWMFARKGKDMQKFVSELKHYWNKKFPKDKLKSRWGRFMPDELFISGVISKNKINAAIEDKPMFFGVKSTENLGDITNNHYFMSLHGNGNGTTLTRLQYWEYYDRMMKVISSKAGAPWYKKHFLMSAKITNRA